MGSRRLLLLATGVSVILIFALSVGAGALSGSPPQGQPGPPTTQEPASAPTPLPQLSVDQIEAARARAIDVLPGQLRAAAAEERDLLGSAQAKDVGPMYEGERLIGTSVLVRLPRKADLAGFELIDVNRRGGRWNSSPRAVDITGVQEIVMMFDFDGLLLGVQLPPTTEPSDLPGVREHSD